MIPSARRAVRLAVLFAATGALVRAECVPFQDAKKLEGSAACVTGKVVKVAQSQTGNWYLDFCENYRECQFTVYIPHGDAKRVGDLRPLQGQQVEIYGKVEPYGGRSEIILKDKRQLEGEKLKFVPPDDDRRRGYRDEHSAAMHGPPHHHFASGAQRSKAAKASKSSSTSERPPSTTAPVVRPQ